MCVVSAGISEMLKPPGNEMNKAPKTQVGGLSTSVAEPSVLNTPEESGAVGVLFLGGI